MIYFVKIQMLPYDRFYLFKVANRQQYLVQLIYNYDRTFNNRYVAT